MRKILVLFMAALMAVSCSVAASAATVEESSSSTTTVYYSNYGQYAVNIPSSLMLTQKDTISVSADYAHLTATQSIVVSIPEGSFGESGYFELIADADRSTMKCTLLVSENGAEAVELTKENAPHTLVTITEENKDTATGTLQVIPQKETATASGVFMGRIQFDISLINTSEE